MELMKKPPPLEKSAKPIEWSEERMREAIRDRKAKENEEAAKAARLLFGEEWQDQGHHLPHEDQ